MKLYAELDLKDACLLSRFAIASSSLPPLLLSCSRRFFP
jgi:hypothetical protein